MTSKIRIAIADDHILFRKGLAQLLADDHYIVRIQADNGEVLIEELRKKNEIQVVLMDINMPIMNGFEATEWIKKHKPELKVIALTMSDSDHDIIRMIRCGAHGYLLKDTEPLQLKHAINEVVSKGYYYTEMISGTLINSMNDKSEEQKLQGLIDSFAQHELDYIKYACSDMNHKEIAEKIGVSPRTIDGYRDHVYSKTGVQTRVGLVIFAIRHGIFKL
jgi:DNA-binding NarL/FixJ family response regulator